MNKVILFLSAVVVSFSALVATAASLNYEEAMSKGRVAFNEGRFEDALKYFEIALEDDMNTPYEREQAKTEIRRCQDILEKRNGANAETYFQEELINAQQLYMNKRYSECKSKCEELLRIYPNHSEDINPLLSRCNDSLYQNDFLNAQQLLINKKYAECKSKCEELLRLYPSHSEEINSLLSRCNGLIAEQEAAAAAEQQAQAEVANAAADLERQYKTEYSNLQFLIIDRNWSQAITKCEAMLEKYPKHKTEIEATYLQCLEGKSQTTPMEAVDLGLSVLWADRNVGAKSISGSGNYYSQSRILTAADSVGNGWRLPTAYELWELQNFIVNHDYNWGTWGDITGLFITGKNNKSIFLPAAGCYYNKYNRRLINVGEECSYYSSTKNVDSYTRREYYFAKFEANECYVNPYGDDDYNHTIRLVKDKPNNIKEPRMVDMGLSVLWSSWNLGATNETEFGNYYAWGEVFQKNDICIWGTYKYFHDKDGNRTPFNDNYKPQDEELTFIGNDIAGTQYDAATVALGSGYMTPNETQWKELIHNCSWTWTTKNGVNGYIVKSYITGNSIFLPAAGFKTDYKIDGFNISGIYMSSELHNVIQAHDCGFNDHRYVTTNSYYNEMLQFKQTDVNEPIVYSYYYGGYPYGSLLLCSHQRYLGQSVRPVKKNDIKWAVTTDTTTYKPKAIDLGLSVLWADCNVGATSSTGWGQVYAWGETVPKILYNWSTYQFFNDKDGNGNPHKKDNYEKLNKSELKNIGRDIAGTQYDVATQLWGNGWQMPTNAQWQELIEKCHWTWTTKNGVNGYLVTGPNGNSVFLPARLSRIDDGTQDGRYPSFYWCSDRGDFDTVDETTSAVSLFGDNRLWFADIYSGCSVRPIKAK